MKDFHIELFGYYLYPAFFALVIGIPILIVVLIILLRKLKERKQVYSTSIITTWEKINIPKILNKEKKSSTNEHYNKILSDLKEFVTDCDYWNTDDILEIDKDGIIILTNLLFNEVKELHKTDPDRCVLLLHAMDNINGGIDYEMGNNFMDEDMQELMNDEKMDANEAKVLFLCSSSLEKLITNYVDPEREKIPPLTIAYEELKDTPQSEIIKAINDVESSVDFTDLKSSTYNMLEKALIDMIDKVLKNQQSDYLDQLYLSYIRTLACVIDRQLYDDILKTIED